MPLCLLPPDGSGRRRGEPVPRIPIQPPGHAEAGRLAPGGVILAHAPAHGPSATWREKVLPHRMKSDNSAQSRDSVTLSCLRINWRYCRPVIAFTESSDIPAIAQRTLHALPGSA